jgi:hypothetical protein
MFSISIAIFGINDSFGDSKKIPSWIKLTAEFWVNEQVSDEEFISVLQYLIDKKILQVPTTEEEIVTPNEDTTTPNPAYIHTSFTKDNSDNFLIHISFWDDSGKTPSLGIPLSPSGDLTIVIISDAKTIFQKNISVSEYDFKWKSLDDGDVLSFTYTIPLSEIQKSAVSDGEIVIFYEIDSDNSFTVELLSHTLPTLSQKEINDKNYQENAIFMDGCRIVEGKYYSCAKNQVGSIMFGVDSIGKYTWNNEEYLRIDFEIENVGTRADITFNPRNFELNIGNCNSCESNMFDSILSASENDIIEASSSHSGILLLQPISQEFEFVEHNLLKFSLYHEGTEEDLVFKIIIRK